MVRFDDNNVPQTPPLSSPRRSLKPTHDVQPFVSSPLSLHSEGNEVPDQNNVLLASKRTLSFPPSIIPKKKKKVKKSAPVYWGLTTLTSPNFNPSRLTVRQQTCLISKCETMGKQLDFSSAELMASLSPFILDRIADGKTGVVAWTQSPGILDGENRYIAQKENTIGPKPSPPHRVKQPPMKLKISVLDMRSEGEEVTFCSEGSRGSITPEDINNVALPLPLGESNELNTGASKIKTPMSYHATEKVPYSDFEVDFKRKFKTGSLVRKEPGDATSQSLPPPSYLLPTLPIISTGFSKKYQELVYQRALQWISSRHQEGNSCCVEVLAQLSRTDNVESSLQNYLSNPACPHRRDCDEVTCFISELLV